MISFAKAVNVIRPSTVDSKNLLERNFNNGMQFIILPLDIQIETSFLPVIFGSKIEPKISNP